MSRFFLSHREIDNEEAFDKNEKQIQQKVGRLAGIGDVMFKYLGTDAALGS